MRALEKACPLLVPLVEEGWVDHPVTAEVIRIYLTELLEQAQEEDAGSRHAGVGLYALSRCCGR